MTERLGSALGPPRSLAAAWREARDSTPRQYDLNNKRIRFGLAYRWWQTSESDYTPHERAAISRARHLAADVLKTISKEHWAVFTMVGLLSTVVAAWMSTIVPSSNGYVAIQILIVATGSLGFAASGLHRRFNIPQNSLEALLGAAICPQCLGRLEPEASSHRARCPRCELQWAATMVRFPDTTEIAKRRPRLNSIHTIADVTNVPVPFSPAYSGGSLIPDPHDPVAHHRTKAVEKLLRIGRWRTALLVALFATGIATVLALSTSTLAPTLISLFVISVIAWLFVLWLPRSLINDWIDSAACPCCDSQLVWCAQREQPGRVRCPTCLSEWISQSLKSLRFASESNTCPRCKYPLTGLTSEDNKTVRCPECALVLSSVRAARCGKCLEPLAIDDGQSVESIECRYCRTTNLTQTPAEQSTVRIDASSHASGPDAGTP